MKICRNCYTPMVGVMSFSKNKYEKFSRCPRCYSETKHQKLRDDEFEFGEVLSKSINKNNKYIKEGKN